MFGFRNSYLKFKKIIYNPKVNLLFRHIALTFKNLMIFFFLMFVKNNTLAQ